jgi:hypothetical protein
MGAREEKRGGEGIGARQNRESKDMVKAQSVYKGIN